MSFSAALIAGGRSSRMGRDKALLEIDGVPLWRRQLETLQELKPSEIFVSVSAPHDCRAFLRNAGRPPASDTDALQRYCDANRIERVPDAMANCGPLGGIVAALRRCKTPQLLALAIDLPNISSELLRQLLALSFNGTGVVPKRNTSASFPLAKQSKGKLKTCRAVFEPLAAIYPKYCLPLAESSLQSGRYALQPFVERGVHEGWMVTHDVTDVEGLLFLNLNTPSDLAAIGKK